MAGFGKKAGGSSIGGATLSQLPAPELSPTEAGIDEGLDRQPTTPAWKGPLFRVAAIGAAAVIATISWFSLQAGASISNPEARHRIDATLAANPGLATMYAAFERYRPEAYHELMQRTSGALSRGDAIAASYVAFAIENRTFYADGMALERADEASLAAWFEAGSATIARAQEISPADCGKLMVEHRWGPLPSDPEFFSDADKWVAAMVEVAHASQTSPQTYPAPSESDGITIAQLLMAQNLSIADIKSLGSSDALEKLAANERCPALVRLTRTILNAPEPARSHFLGQAGAAAAKRAAELSR